MSVIYKCKECGGSIEPQENGLGQCQYCGAIQTLPKEKDDRLQNILNRANDYRMAGDFDRAIYLYEEALKITENEPETHWGLFLSKYGVEYVKDANSIEHKPTLHRISSTSVFDDIDYQATMKYADVFAAQKYKKDAELIESVMKELLLISNNQEPYDIFISYKEQDDITRQKTDDSFLAHNLYNELTGQGYRVFFAPKSLAAGLYEPQIYSAIISSRIMIVLGTKPEYFNAVWVKNEWSRFSELIEKGEEKVIIPVYKYMEAYELPNKLAQYQAYNMDNISFFQSVLDTASTYINKNQCINFDVDSYAEKASLERGFIALEDKNFKQANTFFENVLNLNPHNAQAYFGKLMVELRASTQEQILASKMPLNHYKDFQNAVKFSDQQLKSNLIQYEQKVQENINKINFEQFKSDFYETKSSNDIKAFKSKYNIDTCVFIEDKEYWKNKVNDRVQAISKYELKKSDKTEEINEVGKKLKKYEFISKTPIIFHFLFGTPIGWIFGIVTLLNGFVLGAIAGVFELVFKPMILKKMDMPKKIENLKREKEKLELDIEQLDNDILNRV